MKFHQVLILFFVLISSLFADPVFAQSGNATLRIIATTEDEGTPVIAANVLLTSEEGDTLKAGTTDVYGFLEFTNLAAGTYGVRISYIGYQTLYSSITLEGGQTRIFRPEMATNTAELDELVVRAQRSTVQREAGLQSISPEDLNRIPTPGPGGDLTMYLQTLPSVVTTGDRGGELHIRGGTPSQNLVLIENMPVIKPFHISNLFFCLSAKCIKWCGCVCRGIWRGIHRCNISRFRCKYSPGKHEKFSIRSSREPVYCLLPG